MNKVLCYLVSVFLLVVTTVNNIEAQVNLYSETFTAINGTTVGSGNPSSWSLNINGNSPAVFSVQSNVFTARNTGNEVVLRSRTIFIQGWENVLIFVDMPTIIDRMEANDYINFYYRLNGGVEVAFSTNGINTGNFAAGRQASQTSLKGSTLEIIVKIKNDASDEDHFFDNISVTGSNRIYEEDFNSYSNGTNTSTKWSLIGIATTLSVQSSEFQYRNSNQASIWTSSVVNIATYSSVNLQVRLKENSDSRLENSEWIEVLYKLNGGAETRFATNGYFQDDFTNPFNFIASQNNLTGNTIQIIVKAKTNADDEYYYWDDVFVTANVSAPPAMVLTTTAINVRGCTAGVATGGVQLSVANGRAPFTYLWSNGATTQNISNVATGTYTVTVTANNGATATKSEVIAHPTLLNVSVNKIPPTKNYFQNGSIQLNISGGIPPLSYAWNNKKTTQNIDSLESGSYSWLVTDSLGCTRTNMEYLVYNDTLPIGSSIINMGVSPQTIANGLKPYGLIYQLVRNHKVPVIWAINPSKAKDAKDFTYNGVDYRGGTFVIEEGFITSTVKSLITTWLSKGVVGVYTNSPVIIPVYQKVTGFASLVVDQDNENLVIPYFTNAEIPSSIYTVGLPSNLGACHDFFMLPHADPTWALHGTSMLEGLTNPSNTTQQMNFLSKTGLQCYKSDECGSITEVHASDHIAPVSYDSKFHSHPIMQFMGDMTGATNNGSERWYIPLSTGGWNDNVARALKTNNGSEGKEGIKLAFGYGYNNPLNGIVMYEAGHTAHNRGTIAESVAAQRAFFNFILHASIEKYINSKGDIPNTFINMQGQTVSVTAQGGNPPYTYQWTSTAPGTFINPNAATTQFTPTGGQADRSYFLTCTIQDACGRINYISAPIEFLNISGTVINSTCYGATNGTINITATGGTLPLQYLWSNGATTEDIINVAAGEYEVIVTDAGGYSQNAIFTIEQPSELNYSAIITPTTQACSSDGAITLTPLGATSPYTYSWAGGATTKDRTGLSKSNHSVTITDSRGCNKSFSITVAGPADLAINFMPNNVDTFTAQTGIININVSGGNSPYTYSWCNGETTQNIFNKKAGPYSLVVTDAGGCTVTGSSTIGINNAIVFKGLKQGVSTELTWNSSLNWSGSVLPSQATNVVIPGGCAATVTVPVNAIVKGLVITEGAQLNVLSGREITIDGNFVVSGNFSAGTGNVKFTGNAQQRIITQKILQFYNLTMQNAVGGSLLPDTSIIIQNQLALSSGNIVMGGNDTVVVTRNTSNAIINHSENSYVVGYLCRHINNNATVVYDLPIGYGAPYEYYLASLNSKALKTTTKITASVKPMERSILHFDPNETFAVSDDAISYVYVQPEAMWTIEPDIQPTAGTYDVKLFLANMGNLNDNYFGIIKRIKGGTDADWNATFGSVNSFNGDGRLREHGYALKKGATSFSEFGIGSGRSNPLPVELLLFDAKISDDGKTHVEWYTATEINNDFFTIERMTEVNGTVQEVTKVKGAGNSSVLNSYTAIDSNPLDGISYYRLKQTDYDGTFAYSNWVAIENRTKSQFVFSVYPNPATNYADLEFKNIENELNIQIFDGIGNAVFTKNINTDSKVLSQRLMFSDIMAKGNYFIQVTTGGEIRLQRLIVQ